MNDIFLLYVDFDGSVEIGFDADDEIDFWEFRQTAFVGKRLPENWILPQHKVYEENLPLRDFLMGYDDAPFISQRALDCIYELVKPHVQFVPFGKIQEVNYYIMNVISLIDCLDIKASKISYSPDNPKKILAVDQFAFHPTQKILTPIFKIPQDPGKIFVTMPFVESIRKNKITGVGFECPSDIGVSGPKSVFNDLPLK